MEKQSRYHKIAYNQIRQRLQWILRPLVLLVVILIAIIAVILFFTSGFTPTLVLVILGPVALALVLNMIQYGRATNSVRPEALRSATGYLVDAREMMAHADNVTLTMMSITTQLATGTEDDATATAALGDANGKSLTRSFCLALVSDSLYQQARANGTDLVLEADLSQLILFFVYDSQLAAQAQSLCTEVLPQENYSYRVSREQHKVIFTDVKNTDRTLLEIQ